MDTRGKLGEHERSYSFLFKDFDLHWTGSTEQIA